MRFAIAADHAGFELKRMLAALLCELGHEVQDLGTDSASPVDYPDFAEKVALAVREGRADRGVLVCGSGVGVSVAANKVPGVRAATCWDAASTRNSREHNDANVLSMGGRIVATGLADEILTLWLNTAFEGGRHQRRLDQITAAEKR